MQTRSTFTRATLTVALLSAFVLAQPAHAGLLGGGGGGGLGGGLGGGGFGGGMAGGMGGSFGNRSLNADVGGAAAGQVSPQAHLPRVDEKAMAAAAKAADKAADLQARAKDQLGRDRGVTGSGDGAVGATLDNTQFDARGTAAGQVRQRAGMARVSDKAAETADTTAAKADEQSAAPTERASRIGGKAEAAATRDTRASFGKNASTNLEQGSATGQAHGSGQVSRGHHSVSADGSAQGSVQH